MSKTAKRIATELLGWTPREFWGAVVIKYYETPDGKAVWDFDPESNPKDATRVFEYLASKRLMITIRCCSSEDGTLPNIYGCVIEESALGVGADWMQALSKSSIQYLDDKNA